MLYDLRGEMGDGQPGAAVTIWPTPGLLEPSGDDMRRVAVKARMHRNARRLGDKGDALGSGLPSWQRTHINKTR